MRSSGERPGRSPPPSAAARSALLGRGQTLDERINKLLSAKALTDEQEKTLDDLRQQASEGRRELLELNRQFEQKYGALASRPATIDEAQKALPEETSLLGWIDTGTEHWACLLGHSGDPAWVRLIGSGKDGRLDQRRGRSLAEAPRRARARDDQGPGRPAG